MKKLLFAALAFFSNVVAFATPSVSSISGTVSYGSTLDVLGSNFGTKPGQQKTFCFANFEDASAGVACSSWSYQTQMDNLQNVAIKSDHCLEGTGCVGPAADISLNKNNTARVTINDVGVGGKILWSWDWRWDGTYPTTTQNWKVQRMWAASELFNDAYCNQQVDAGFGCFTESHDFGGTTGVDRIFSSRNIPPLASYDQVVNYTQLNSDASTSQTDGVWSIDWHNNAANLMTINTWRSNTAADSANGRYLDFYPIHHVMANTSFPAGGDFRFDNIIIETSYCVVWVSTNSTLAAQGVRYWLVVQTWANGEITAVFAQNAFTNGQTVYLYVMENGKTVNASGYPLIVASSSGGTPPLQPTEANQFCPCLP